MCLTLPNRLLVELYICNVSQNLISANNFRLNGSVSDLREHSVHIFLEILENQYEQIVYLTLCPVGNVFTGIVIEGP